MDQTELCAVPSSSALFAGAKAQTRFREFVAANIHKKHTRRACDSWSQEFLAWCERHGLASVVRDCSAVFHDNPPYCVRERWHRNSYAQGQKTASLRYFAMQGTAVIGKEPGTGHRKTDKHAGRVFARRRLLYLTAKSTPEAHAPSGYKSAASACYLVSATPPPLLELFKVPAFILGRVRRNLPPVLIIPARSGVFLAALKGYRT
jgi:hypothetical protein